MDTEPFPELSEETVRAPMAPSEPLADVVKDLSLVSPVSFDNTTPSPAEPPEEDPILPTIAVQPEDLLSRDTARLPDLNIADELDDDASYDAKTVYLPKDSVPAAPKKAKEQPQIVREPKKPTKSKTPRKKGRGALIAGIVTASVLVLCLLGLLIFGMVLKNGDFIYPNVYVTDQNVGGMDRETAIAAVKQEMENSYASSTLKVELPDRVLEFTPDKTNVAVDAEAAIDEAMAYGRSCGPFRAVFNYIASSTDKTKDYRVSQLELNTDYIRSTLEETAAQVRREPSPCTVNFDEEARQLQITVGQAERTLDVDGLYDTIYAAFEQGNFETITWPYNEIPAEMPELEQIFETYCTPVQDAYYDETTHTIVEAVAGYGFDLEEVRQQMAIAEPGSSHVIDMGELEPKKDIKAVEEEMFGTELFSYSTPYVNNANRTKNLTLACQAIDGIILNPGDEFSFNNIVGERTAAKGYMQATVYNGGLSVPELGGGVCQVASTLYYCTLHLDLEQVQREPHMFVVDYVPKGMDATIYWGKLDYKFKNTLDFPIRILINTEGGSVNATFQGAKPLDYTVKMEFAVLATYGYQELEQVDETKEPGYSHVEVTPYVGYRVETYKTIYDLDGNELSRKLEATSSYSKRDKLTIVGPPETPDDPFDPDLWDPDNPDNPDNPDVPDDPDVPDPPDQPDDPTPPDDPEIPDDPFAPEDPEIPDDPFAPEDPVPENPGDGLGDNDLPIA